MSAGKQIEHITGEGETLAEQLSDLEKNLIKFLDKFYPSKLPLPTERRSIWPIVIDRRKYTLRVFQRRIKETLKEDYKIFLQQNMSYICYNSVK